ncbi:MAG: hypothetical protein E6K14_07010 [Methanobacteriota archaeon]|nr:MAG: hypothetical protein E6K14_07010 [Euryarchaeota archaeon]
MAAPELVVGILPSARMRTTDYDLIVTDRRLVGAKIGTPGLAPAAGFVLGGVVGYSIGRGLSRGQAAQRARYAGLSIDQIIGSDRQNFHIPIAWIERGEFTAGINMVVTPRLTLWVPGQELTFKFMNHYWAKDKAEVQYIADVLAKILPGRITFKGIGGHKPL